MKYSLVLGYYLLIFFEVLGIVQRKNVGASDAAHKNIIRREDRRKERGEDLDESI